jgi:fructosamine-3-kinase
MIDEILQKQLSTAISEHLKVKILINDAKSIHGGDINQAYRINTNEGYFFLKMNDASRYPDMFAQEYLGMHELQKADALPVPKPLMHGKAGDQSFLLLEYITKGQTITDFWDDFALLLARQHRVTQQHYGFVTPNYLGTLKQYNTPYSNWAVF